MRKSSKTTIEVKGTAITVLSQEEKDFICLADIAPPGYSLICFSLKRAFLP